MHDAQTSEVLDVDETMILKEEVGAEGPPVWVDEAMIVAVARLPHPFRDEVEEASAGHPWGELGGAIEAWFEAGDAGWLTDDGEADESWVVVESSSRPRPWVFDPDDDTDTLVDVVLPRA